MTQQQSTTSSPTTKNKLWKKIVYSIAIGVTGITVISLGSGIYLVNTIDKRLPLIQRLISKHTGYAITVDKIDSGFTNHGQPYVTIDGLKILAPEQIKPFIQIDNLQLILSYSSLWHLMPIFSSLQISGSSLFLDYDKNDNLILNGRIITNLIKPSTPTNFDFERWLWQQKNIIINDINLSLLDSKHHMLPLAVNDIFINIHNAAQHMAYARIDLGNGKIEAGLNFTGNSITTPTTIRNGELQLNSIGNNGYLLNLNAQVNNGSLQFIHANLNSNNQQIVQIIDNYQDIRDFNGALQIDKKNDDPNAYTVFAHDLTLNTTYGYLFNHAEISGEINNTAEGKSYLNINNLQLDGANSLLKLTQFSDKMTFSGLLNTINIFWHGTLSSPQNPQLTTSFKNLALSSQEANIPSFNHLNGQLFAGESSGVLNLQLDNGKINYPSAFYLPLTVNHFNSHMSWQIESNNQVKLFWDNVSLQMPQLEFITNGNYDINNSQINASGQIKYLNLADVYQILPRSIPNSGVKYLHDSLKSGYFRNINLAINGDPRAFPFENGGGNFTASGILENTDYQFMPDWKGLTAASGKLNVHNQFTQLTLTSGKLGDIAVEQAKITLPDSNAQYYTINLEGQASGQSSDFLTYLESSPFGTQILKAQDLISITGRARVKIKAAIPLNNPAALKLNGNFEPESNQIAVTALPTLTIDNLSGQLGFDTKGVAHSTLNATVFNSPIALTIPAENNFALTSPNFNFSALINFIYPPLESVIYGTAPVMVNYNLLQQKLTVNSTLESVTIDTPAPLRKVGNYPSLLQISTNLGESNPEIYANYENNLFARMNITSASESRQIQIAIGEDNYSLKHPLSSAPVTIKASVDDFRLLEWGQFINKLLGQQNKPATSESQARANDVTALVQAESTLVNESNSFDQFLPIQVELNANAFWLNNYNLDGGTADVIVDAHKIHAQINTPDLQGMADYYQESNNLFLNLDKLIYSSANFLVPAQAAVESQDISVSALIESNLAAFARSKAQSDAPTESNTMSSALVESANVVESQPAIESTPSNLPLPNFPTTTVNINDLYFQGHYLGSLSGKIYPADSSLYFENFILKNKAATTRINGLDYCANCNDGSTYTIVNVHSDVNDLGSLVNKIELGDMFHNGNGTIDLSFKWVGNLWDFKVESTLGAIDINMANGDLTHVNPGLVGVLIGVINLSAISNLTNLNHFNFNNLFGQGFAYKDLHTTAQLKDNILTIQELQLNGEVATVNSFGDYYIASNSVDSYVSVEPRLGGTVATTAGIVTLNPFIGIFVYLGEKLIGDPINKALAISYHITGNVESPTFTQTKISSQLMQNFKSSMNFIPLPSLPATNNNEGNN